MSGWQPIETAPRDGADVLLGRFVAKCRHGKSGRVRVDYWRSREKGDGYEGWGMFNEQFWPATHWMPIPAPPQAHHVLTPEEIKSCSQAELEARGCA